MFRLYLLRLVVLRSQFHRWPDKMKTNHMFLPLCTWLIAKQQFGLTDDCFGPWQASPSRWCSTTPRTLTALRFSRCGSFNLGAASTYKHRKPLHADASSVTILKMLPDVLAVVLLLYLCWSWTDLPTRAVCNKSSFAALPTTTIHPKQFPFVFRGLQTCLSSLRARRAQRKRRPARLQRSHFRHRMKFQ